jgi:hypothetical protein
MWVEGGEVWEETKFPDAPPALRAGCSGVGDTNGIVAGEKPWG